LTEEKPAIHHIQTKSDSEGYRWLGVGHLAFQAVDNVLAF